MNSESVVAVNQNQFTARGVSERNSAEAYRGALREESTHWMQQSMEKCSDDASTGELLAAARGVLARLREKAALS